MDLQKLKIRIEKLNKDELVEVFKIIHKNNVKYTSNNNGIFIDLNICSNETIEDIKLFLNFIDENKKRLNELEEKVNTKKIIFTTPQQIQKTTTFITNDYSPYVTVDNEIDYDINNDNEDIENLDNKSILTDISDNEIEDDDDETIILGDNINNNSKKKKALGIKSRLLKRCKSLYNNYLENEDLDKDDNLVNKNELSLEIEYI